MGALKRAQWRPLIVDGGWNAELRRAFDRKSGAYAIREKGGRVLYVGESHTGRGWKTLTRHFQDASGKFAAVRETFVHSRPGELEGALWVTRGAQQALDAQAELITRFRREGHELVNIDDGRAATDALRTSGRDRRLAAYGAPIAPPSRDVSGEEEDFFGSFASNPPPKLVDAPVERRAENRTPDLFTGRTRLEEGAKGRKDWKGEAERTARELAECRRASTPAAPVPIVQAPAPRPRPPVLFDERGQGTMFSKRNPKRPTFPEARKALLQHLATRGWTVTTYAQGHTLKIPYATIEPTSQPPIRIWLHPQSIYRQQTMGAFDHARARSTSWDMREPPEVLERLLVGRPAEAAPRVVPSRIETTAEDRGRVLRLVESGRAHSLPIAALSRADLVAAAQLESEGLLRRMPARGQWPPRFVVTAGGSHHLGTFDSDDRNFRDDSIDANNEARRKRLTREAVRATVNKLGGFATVAQVRAAGYSDAEILAADAAREVTLKEGNDPKRRNDADCILVGDSTYQFVLADEAPRAAEKRAKPAGYGVEERGKKKQGQLRMFNPARLVVLGDLVSIAYRAANGRRHTLRWGARGAPIVAYDPAKSTGALVLIFGPAVVGSGSAASAKEYKRTHWGQAGDGNRLAGDVLRGKAPKLGTALEITYATTKGGDSKLVNYWHTFGDFGTFGGKRAFIPPAVVAATLGGRQLVRLDGGTYTVKAHGIVG